MNYNYAEDIAEATKLIEALEGSVLTKVLINVVEPEFNVVFLDTSNGVFAVQGESGGEYLGIRHIKDMPSLVSEQGYIICEYPPYNAFLNHTICQIRQIGTAWNGHGLELSFQGITDQTMIIQSIYSGDKPKDLEDCLRLGIGQYSDTWNG
ncbi:hypothetical protein [Alteromonas stellipolaris]|uniref:hypothetical protein n=1 Tax=Alteromonas stellipolaris TaxID=233316 RepID=UPI0027364DD5|nr:hypothetical protein [Alteromonas stellipolaris]MDP2596396.1 hypothetical protein [Alteromonas stellipolaris]